MSAVAFAAVPILKRLPVRRHEPLKARHDNVTGTGRARNRVRRNELRLPGSGPPSCTTALQ